MLSESERRKLLGLLARLGSDNEHERAVAATLATQMLRSRDLRWEDVVSPQPKVEEPHSHVGGTRPYDKDPRAFARSVLYADVFLTDWEEQFLHSFAYTKRSKTLSEKQRAVMERFYERMNVNARRESYV